MTLAGGLLGFVTLQRGAELLIARRNTKRLVARGAFEVGAWHYGLIVTLHAAWLGGLWLLGRNAELWLFWVVLFAVLQLMRIWVILSLGERWTTRIIVLPGLPLERKGPYRFVKHPNYLVVAGEIAALPLALGMPWFALAFSIANAAVLTVRIKAEDAALAAASR